MSHSIPMSIICLRNQVSPTGHFLVKSSVTLSAFVEGNSLIISFIEKEDGCDVDFYMHVQR